MNKSTSEYNSLCRHYFETLLRKTIRYKNIYLPLLWLFLLLFTQPSTSELYGQMAIDSIHRHIPLQYLETINTGIQLDSKSWFYFPSYRYGEFIVKGAVRFHSSSECFSDWCWVAACWQVYDYYKQSEYINRRDQHQFVATFKRVKINGNELPVDPLSQQLNFARTAHDYHTAKMIQEWKPLHAGQKMNGQFLSR